MSLIVLILAWAMALCLGAVAILIAILAGRISANDEAPQKNVSVGVTFCTALTIMCAALTIMALT
ncbi:hypothetical protein [Celeribacter ethanolicus]|uniref:hypothetical protein n=1 Tax=Celeribacter ethanolicus TaxID=1758178 RepID=UPI0008336D14|nr:hypothetical protein [Celeribacter ethanolicus]